MVILFKTRPICYPFYRQTKLVPHKVICFVEFITPNWKGHLIVF
jgi:hypothetical protein